MRLEWLPVAAVLLILVGLLAVITRPVDEVRASADAGGFNVTLILTSNIGATGVVVTYWPEHQLYCLQYLILGRIPEKHIVVGTCNGTRSDPTFIEPGQTVVCRFPAKLDANTRYFYEVSVRIGYGIITVARGSVVPKN